jgi:hypothetical protein
MANKITLDTITSSFASTSLFNTNFAAIKTELDEKVLYRNNPTGEANQMLNDLDMNSNDILNASSVNADVIVLNGTQITPTGTTSLPASGLTYDNSTSGLTATNVQDAIDEVDSTLDTVEIQQAQGQNYGKNLIINGDFSIWQRGTSQTSNGYGSVDRWLISTSGGATTLSRQEHILGQTDVPGARYFARQAVTTGSDFLTLAQKIEDVTVTAGKQVTLSFYAKGTNPGGGFYTIFSEQNFGTGGSPSANILTTISDTLAVTSSWVRYEYTFTVDSISGKTLGTNNNHSFTIFFDQGSDTSTDAYTLDISNVQLEFGDTATEFEYVSPADQEARCKRYFERRNYTTSSIAGILQAISTTVAWGPLDFSPKRTAPVITFNGQLYGLTAGGGAVGSTVLSSANTGLDNARWVMTAASTLNAGDAVAIFANASSYIDIDAEL